MMNNLDQIWPWQTEKILAKLMLPFCCFYQLRTQQWWKRHEDENLQNILNAKSSCVVFFISSICAVSLSAERVQCSQHTQIFQLRHEDDFPKTLPANLLLEHWASWLFNVNIFVVHCFWSPFLLFYCVKHIVSHFDQYYSCVIKRDWIWLNAIWASETILFWKILKLL